MVSLVLLAACGSDRPDGWGEESHGKNATPAYDVVFPKDKVQRLDIVIAASDWQAMQDDMTDMMGAFGQGGGPGGNPGGDPDGGGMPGPGGPGGPGDIGVLEQACVGKAAGDVCTATLQGNAITGTCGASPIGGNLLCRPDGGGIPGGGPGGPPDGGMIPGNGGPGGGNGDIIPNTPIYVPSTVRFEGKTWWYVGVRFKGNSSLSQAWRSGVGKMPLRLNFDKFEDEHPEVDGQKFYGFANLSLSNAVADPSLIRNKVATDIFRESGIPASHATYAAVYVDHGEGPQYFGLYTMAEQPGDSLLTRVFGDDNGALYEADGTGARWQAFDKASFEQENKRAEEVGWPDIEAAIAALNSDRTDAAAWRTRLEERFNVDGFLKWLAVNTVMMNWDAYGAMAHNYYLYSHPGQNGRLQWITWDHDRAMQSGMRPTSLTHDETDATWPLIRFLLDDPVYKPVYQGYAREAVQGLLAPESFQQRLKAEHALVAPWVVGENAEQPGYTFLNNAQEFQDALTGANGLLDFAAGRQAAVQSAFGTSP